MTYYTIICFPANPGHPNIVLFHGAAAALVDSKARVVWIPFGDHPLNFEQIERIVKMAI